MRKSDFLDELQLSVLTQCRNGLGDLEHGANNVVARVSQIPQLPQRVKRRIHVSLKTCLEHGLDLDGVWGVYDLEYIVSRHHTETGMCRLQVVDRLSHITFRTKHQRGQTLVIVLDLLGLDDLQQPLDHLRIRQPRIPQDGTSRLERLDDLVGLVTRKREPGGIRVNLHRPAQGLLCARRHAVGLVENDNLVSARGERDLLLGEALDPVAHHIDTTLVRRVELQHCLLIGVAQQLPRQAQYARGLTDARHARDDDMGHVAISGNNLEALDRLDVSDYIVEEDGAVFLDPITVVSLFTGQCPFSRERCVSRATVPW